MATIINCVGGYGDILFCEPIFKYFLKKDGERPFVIIHPHQMWIQTYIESARFDCHIPEYFQTGSLFHNEEDINLRYANQIFRGLGPDDHHDLENMMLDKYRLLGLPEDLWKSLDIKIYGVGAKYDKLYRQYFPIYWNNYHVLNESSQVGTIKLNSGHMHTIRMSEQPGYNVIDWWMLIHKAFENHHVSTSTFFLMQAIKNKFPEWNAPCYIYPRPNVDGLRGISQLKPDFNLIKVENGTN